MLKCFVAAGKPYKSWKDLCVKKTEHEDLYKDIYGREWAYTRERYPCFDSFDLLHEDRYFRWFVHRENGEMTLVYVDDGKKELTVIQNPESWRYTCREMLKRLGWIE